MVEISSIGGNDNVLDHIGSAYAILDLILRPSDVPWYGKKGFRSIAFLISEMRCMQILLAFRGLSFEGFW